MREPGIGRLSQRECVMDSCILVAVATPYGTRTVTKKVTDTPPPSTPHNTKKELEPEEREEKGNSRPGPLFHFKFPCRVKT